MGNPRRTAIMSSGSSSKYRLLLLALGLLNIVLLISAVVIGINCAKVKKDSLHVTHPAAVQLLNKLRDLHSNHSDVIQAEEDAKRQLQAAIDEHAKFKTKLAQQRALNDDYQRQLESLRTERSSLRSNLTTLEASCGKCPPGFIVLNSSCYYFSAIRSKTIKKNWHQSRADCIGRGSDLVVIGSPEEQTFVGLKVKALGGEGSWPNGFWLGLTDIGTEEEWVWVNNVTEVEQRYWMDGEPNNHGPDGEDCASMIYTPRSPWKTRTDAKCNTHELRWICEKEMVA